MTTTAQTEQSVGIEDTVEQILSTIEREREREIISRRFGLYDRKETLEQIGELIGITRERVRQLEKSVITKLKNSTAKGEIPYLQQIQAQCLEILNTNGHIMRVAELAEIISGKNDKISQSRMAFIATLAPELAVIEENDNYFNSVGEKSVFDEKNIKDLITKIVKAIKALGQPSTIAKITSEAGLEDPNKVRALASVSKSIAHLNNKWGLTKWPTVNPKNIRDKIYVILSEKGKHLHFNDIAEAIKQSDFKRKNVTTQAIHNELIKDKRFVLIGRGIYALSEWGYKKGTVSDIITEVLRDSGEPLHRDEIVKRVLKNRHVKETTILLNLQGKKQFKRVAKATYTLDESAL